jgi:RPA family protein
MQYKREIAIKLMIKDIVEADYSEDLQNPFISVFGRQIKRVNCMGALISSVKTPGGFSLTIEDSTGSIMAQYFEDEIKANVGDIVNIVGRVRTFENEKFLVPEILKKVDNLLWMEYHRKNSPELLKNLSSSIEKVPEKQETTAEKLLSCIRVLDDGNGAYVDNVVSTVRSPDSESQVKKLLELGTIFETAPGKVKILE